MRQRSLKETIDRCTAAFARGWAFASAVGLATLLEAEESQLVDSGWHTLVDLAGVKRLIESNPAKLVNARQDNAAQLEQVITHPSRLEFEEAMLVLTLRSTLQSGARMLAESPRARLVAIDETLSTCLTRNHSVAQQCRGSRTLGLEAHIASHWWWHQDAP
jgi:hypothetical protein